MVASAPTLRAYPPPRFSSRRMMRMPGSTSAATAAVRSPEASSTTTTSSGGRVCARTDRRVSAMNGSASKAGITTAILREDMLYHGT